MRWTEAMKRPVVDTSTADKEGKVGGFAIDADQRRITHAVVGGKLVSFEDCGGVGDDALTITDTSMLVEPSSDREKRIADGDLDPIGKPLLSENGDELGEIVDIEFDGKDGTVHRLIIEDDDLAGSRLLGAGSYAVVVRALGREGSDADDLDGLTKAELYELAQERDIDGRSSMTKDELVSALR